MVRLPGHPPYVGHWSHGGPVRFLTIIFRLYNETNIQQYEFVSHSHFNEIFLMVMTLFTMVRIPLDPPRSDTGPMGAHYVY